ncbi:uncharacterized protein EAF01_003756 [Botrytis porri]|uniref:Phosphoribosyltransferase domain-containing protein n=1 Tax=Botrytis porri TaxID=87229 RepID=A0A4Z1KM05_9HELO|nr:uncharacterized protein EAF01_003756 [Botrytis porri]KAF7910038.1 hypothetical protein EAF01_003756 [Botrytis porri]TGO87091.1 hypothetical protein BPOR_0251g00120 [Botrytis porri]
MSVQSLLSTDAAFVEPPQPDEQDKQSCKNTTSAPLSITTNQSTEPTSHHIPYYPYETIAPPYQFSFAASLTPDTSLLLPIRPLGDTTNGIAVCSLALPHASVTVVRELARIVASKIRKFNLEVVMGLPTGGLVLAPFVAEELGFDRHIPWGYTKKPWYGDQLTTKISCLFDKPGQGPPVYLDPNLLSLVKGNRIALINDVISSGTTMSAILKFLTDKELVDGEESSGIANDDIRKEAVDEVTRTGGMGMNIVCIGVGMLQGDGYKTELSADVVRMIVGAMESPLLKAVEGGWIPR